MRQQHTWNWWNHKYRQGCWGYPSNSYSKIDRKLLRSIKVLSHFIFANFLFRSNFRKYIRHFRTKPVCWCKNEFLSQKEDNSLIFKLAFRNIDASKLLYLKDLEFRIKLQSNYTINQFKKIGNRTILFNPTPNLLFSSVSHSKLNWWERRRFFRRKRE